MSSFHRAARALSDGVYEQVVTDALDSLLDARRREHATIALAPLNDEGLVALCALVTDAVSTALRAAPEPAARLALANAVLGVLGAQPESCFAPEELRAQPRVLRAIASPVLGAASGIASPPASSLSRAELLVNAEKRSVLSELLSEFDSADEVDLLCSFLKWSGFSRLRVALERHLVHHGRPLRVLTTTYLGATDARVLDELSRMGAQLRVSYDGESTRLHAKAWYFRRRTGFHTAYVGSSNLSAAALTEGLEWNVRLTAVDTPQLLERFANVFASYWENPEAGFEPYTLKQRDRLDAALARGRRERTPELSPIATLEVHPWSFQRELLESLEAARALGRHRNLVVAATGTGKTVVAALDYRRLRAQGRDTLLFVAHREELLSQALSVFRQVLRDPSFGELWVGGERPAVGRHVFASIQSLARASLTSHVAPAHFDVVIMDEVHHAAAPTYAALLRHLKPLVLLGLTATPERPDGLPLHEFFDHPYAAELRLWDAIDRQLLVPFVYFGVDDGTDLSGVRWVRGRYDRTALSATLVGADKLYLERIVQALARYLPDPHRAHALAFCVDVTHAQWLTERLRARGLRAEVLTGETSDKDRASHLARLRSKGPDRINFLCTVDLFNEGVDVPEIDTLLMLRPTESATVFLQQLGRGLRRSEGKDSLLVLDFVGKPAKQFRFDKRYRALLACTRGELKKGLERGFDRLPSGCSIQLEERAMKTVLASVCAAIPSSSPQQMELLRSLGERVTLAQYLDEAGLEVDELYDAKRSWSTLRAAAGFACASFTEEEAPLLPNLAYVTHARDARRLGAWRRLAEGNYADDELSLRLERMLYALLFDPHVAHDLELCRARWQRCPTLRAELLELLEVLQWRSTLLPTPFDGGTAVPLVGHAEYRLVELLVAWDHRSKKGRFFLPQTGVFLLPTARRELLLVTLDKSKKAGSPHLQYEDYALTPTEFHWQSQARTRLDSEAGRRHTQPEQEGVTPVLLVRPRAKDERGIAVPYVLLGAARCLRHEGERPISVVWQLERPIPVELTRRARAAVA